MSKRQQELWLLLSLVVIAALLNFLVSSQRVVLCLFFLPTLYSAYSFGRRSNSRLVGELAHYLADSLVNAGTTTAPRLAS